MNVTMSDSSTTPSDEQLAINEEHARMEELMKRPPGQRLGGYIKLSGPGWLQSAITLGGGSLASSLYLGVIAGYSLMWLQPLAMILGIIMLSAIGYVTLSTGEKPFKSINEHINPVMGWGWALAVCAANIVWCLPQYSLATGVVTQNLANPAFGDIVVGEDGKPLQENGKDKSGFILAWGQEKAAGVQKPDVSGDNKFTACVKRASYKTRLFIFNNIHKLIIVTVLLVIATIITWSYDHGGWGIKLYETILKLMVAAIVLCFIGVVIVISRESELDWSAILAGLRPDLNSFSQPAKTFEPLLSAISSGSARKFWSDSIVSQQRDVMIAAAATAVGINMTFLFPYSLLRKKWNKNYRGLVVFDLSTGMFIPYIIATGCVVIASGHQFHTKVDDFRYAVTDEDVIPAGEKDKGAYEKLLADRDKSLKDKALAAARKKAEADGSDKIGQLTVPAATLAEKKLAAALVKRDAFHLAKSLAPLTGETVANYVFGAGVLAMTLSTISLLMLISGFVFAEILGCEPGGVMHRTGTLVAGVLGASGPFIWGEAAFYLAVPTSVFGLALLPFAYLTFVFMMNQRSLLGENMFRGGKRLLINLLLCIAAFAATASASFVVWNKAGWKGAAAVIGFVVLAAMVQINRHNTAKAERKATTPSEPTTPST